ncbi:MAG: hypothetical protein ACFFCZ_23015 [Promethearchaeota archaeon]
MDMRKKQLREKLQALTNNWKWRLASYLLRSDPTWEWSNEIPFLVPDQRTFFDAKIDVAREIVQDLKNAIDMNIEELANETNRLKREYMLILSTLIRRANMARDKVLRTQLLSKQEVVRDFLKELKLASEGIEGRKTSDLR